MGKTAQRRENRGSEADAKTRQQELPVDIAYKKIKEMMYHHEIVPGQKLLYQELAKKLNMSNTPIIQALNRLQVMNIVYSEHNRGFYVGNADPIEVDELFTAREALETFLIPEVIKNLTSDKVRELERAIDEHVEAASVPEYRRLLMIKDTNFHLQIIKIAENNVIYELSKMIFERIYLKYRPEYMREERLKEAAKEHRAILQALKARDLREARNLVRRHIRNGRDHIAGSLWEGREYEIEI